MTTTWDFAFRKHFRTLKRDENGDRGGEGVSARFDILFMLTLHANDQGRCWPKVETLADEVGCTKTTAIAAMEWLREHEAFCNVPYPYRQPAEENLSPKKHVYQLTGFIRLDGEKVYYLYVNPETRADMERNFEQYTAASSTVEGSDSPANGPSHSPGNGLSNGPGNERLSAGPKVCTDLEVRPEKVSPTTEPFRAGEAGAPTASPPKTFSFDRNADAPVAPPDTGSGSPGRREDELLDQRRELEKIVGGILGRKTISAQAIEILTTHSSTHGGPPEAHLPSPNQAYDEDPLYFRWVNESRVPFFIRERAKNPKEWTSVHIARYLRATYGVYQEWAEKQEGDRPAPAISPDEAAPVFKIGAKEWFNWKTTDHTGEGDEAE